MEAINACQMLSFPLDHGVLRSSLCSFVSEDAIDGADAWRVFTITDAFFHEAVTNLPGKNGGILLLVLNDLVYYWRGSNLRFAPTYRSWTDGTCLVESSQDFTDAAMRDQKPSGNFAWSDAARSELHDPVTNIIWERSTVHEWPSKLIDSAVALEKEGCCRDERQNVNFFFIVLLLSIY